MNDGVPFTQTSRVKACNYTCEKTRQQKFSGRLLQGFKPSLLKIGAVFATVVLVENFHVPMLFLKLCFIKILILQICALCLPFQSGLVSIYLQIFPLKFLFVK